jgi:hypothetical protein
MTKADTTPSEWRRRAELAGGRTAAAWPEGVLGRDVAQLEEEQEPSGGLIGPSGRVELGVTAIAGWSLLEQDRLDTAARAARFCRRFAWEQPPDVLGFLIGWEDDHPAEPLVRAHAANERFGAIGAGALFLARHFEETGEDEDLDAAIELHDVVVALGDDVWQPENLFVGWAAAVLYRVTGEEAFLATVERMADIMCETQQPDGTWADHELTAGAAVALADMADSVEARQAVEEELEGSD